MFKVFQRRVLLSLGRQNSTLHPITCQMKLFPSADERLLGCTSVFCFDVIYGTEKAEPLKIDARNFDNRSPVTFSQQLHLKSQKHCSALASDRTNCPFKLFKATCIKCWREGLKKRSVFSYLHFPGGGLSPSEQSGYLVVSELLLWNYSDREMFLMPASSLMLC